MDKTDEDRTEVVSRSMSRRRAQRIRRRVTGGIVVAVAVAAGALTLSQWPTGGENSSAKPKPHSTATVQRTTLASGLKIDGMLGHAPADEISAQGAGTFTKLPKNGDQVGLGKPLYEIDAQPVVLFRGSRPFWRVLEKGMSDGPDVKVLERNLTDLGYANAADLTVDEKFTDATAEAIKRWQKALGVPQTGRVAMGRVVVLPYRAVRVEEVVAKSGTAASANSPALKVTTLDVYATIKPNEEQLPLLPPGSEVTVSLDAGGSIPGKITSITRDAGPNPNGDTPRTPDGNAKPVVSILLVDQKEAAAALSSGRIGATVTVQGKKAANVLVVPVTALLATYGGGYGVEVVEAGSAVPKLVRVELGLIVANQAEVKGQLKEGDKVVVPQ
ncbi:peptidoglycan-binding protein [Streptomyces mirabilis]|uniref:peptidoglycan-binding protein n=1 Tax=Streptomyces mirabilis TaxID=68239 RepID=UPI0036616734